MHSNLYNHYPTLGKEPASFRQEKKENHPATALIVDDEVDICFLLRGILRYKSIVAEYVTSLGAAQHFLESHDPPVIFLDNRLTDGFGINHIRSIKSAHPNSKIVMITAHDTVADRQKAYEEGVDFFIGKPFTKELILNTIEKIES